MIKKIEHIINNSPLYNLLRFNIFSEFFVEVLQKKTRKDIDFYSSFLAPNKKHVAFDIGANKGNKVKAFLKMGYQVIALEPEKKSIETLQFRYSKNKRVTIVAKGVSDKEGTMELHITDARSGLNTFSDKWIKSLSNKNENRWNRSDKFKDSYEVSLTTVDSLMDEYGVPYFIKIDVEGFELNVIKGIKRLPNYLSFELNLPEFIDEANEIINYLSNLNGLTKYQYSFNEKLESKNWISKEEILNVINTTKQRYFEVICCFDHA
jgi:FkbM family methyltransferase